MHTTRLRAPALLTGLAILASSVLLPAAAATAEEGAPPASQTRQVISGVHTDAVSTFVDDGQLTLGTKADIGGLGQRFDPDASVINVEAAAHMTLPANASYSFLGEPGSDLWLAPETQIQGVVWPGFSTESIARGILEDNKVTIALTDWAGPGELEVWDSSGAFGAPGRMFSTRDGSGLSNSYTFAVPQHKHANWGFSAAGTYSLTFTATATVNGTQQTSTQAYTFTVGDIADVVTTTTALSLSANALILGESATAIATVEPATADGWVEFFDGETSLGHAEVTGANATLVLGALPLGDRAITASFTPRWTNDFIPSASAASVVSVTEESDGDIFSIRGVNATYASGDRLTARVVGLTVPEGHVIRWVIAANETPKQLSYLSGDDGSLVTTPTIERELTSSYNGHSIQARLYDTVKKRTVQTTAMVPLVVTGENRGSGVPLTISGLADSYYVGDVADISTETELADGQVYHWVSRYVRTSSAWTDTFEGSTPTGDNPFVIVPSNFNMTELALQIREADGTVVGQSPAVTVEVKEREVQVSGLQNVYRAGDTLSISVDIFPAVEGATFTWSRQEGNGLVPIEGAIDNTLTLPVTSDMNGARIYYQADEPRVGAYVAFGTVTVTVTDAAPGQQVLNFASVPGHYHQGNTVSLKLMSDPAPADSDTYRWSWLRPDQSHWVPIEGNPGDIFEVRAQQALNGTKVRADLVDAEGKVLASAEPATIHVDDHGAAPAEKAAITGLSSGYGVGDAIKLTASVTPDSVLDTWAWYVQRVGDTVPSVLTDVDGPNLNLEAISELNGASVFARLTFDDKKPHIESSPVLLVVNPADPTVPTPDPTDPTDPTVPTVPTPDPTVPATPADPAEPSTPDSSKPTAAPAERSGADLGGSAAGGIDLNRAEVAAGSGITVRLGTDHANQWVAAWLFSEPQLLSGDWVQANSAGDLALTIPSRTPAGEHSVAVFDTSGAIIGWQAITITEAQPAGTITTDRLADTGFNGAGAAPFLGAGLLLLLAGGVLLARRRLRGHGLAD